MNIDSETEPYEIACPFCDTLELMLFTEEDLNWIGCLNCRACGPTADTAEQAAIYWLDRPTDAPEYVQPEKEVFEH